MTRKTVCVPNDRPFTGTNKTDFLETVVAGNRVGRVRESIGAKIAVTMEVTCRQWDAEDLHSALKRKQNMRRCCPSRSGVYRTRTIKGPIENPRPP